MSSRALSDWLTAYLRYTEQSEPPVSYHTWTGISVLAGAMQRRCFLRWGFEMLYPNLYIVLVGPSGRARKGIAMGIGKGLLREIQGLTVISESITREGLILAMKRSTSTFEEPSSGQVQFQTAVTCVSEELSVFLGQKDIKFLAALTDWYDSAPHWTYETKGTGRDDLKGVCFNLLGGTAPDWIQSMLPQEAVGGGFTSRVIFVVEDRKGKTIPKPELTDEEQEIREALIHDLERISQLAGPFRFTPAGESYYTDWYQAQDRQMDSGELPIADPRFASYCERRATHLRKLGMVLSASRGDSLEIDAMDLDRALKILRPTELKMYKTFGGLGQAKYSEVTEKVMDYIAKVGVTTRSKLLSVFYRDMDAGTLKIAEELMVQMKIVKISHLIEKNEVTYQWIGPERQ